MCVYAYTWDLQKFVQQSFRVKPGASKAARKEK